MIYSFLRFLFHGWLCGNNHHNDDDDDGPLRRPTDSASHIIALKDIAEEIINNAIKELSIERGVQEVAEIWQQTLFIILPYEGRGRDSDDTTQR